MREKGEGGVNQSKAATRNGNDRSSQESLTPDVPDVWPDSS